MAMLGEYRHRMLTVEGMGRMVKAYAIFQHEVVSVCIAMLSNGPSNQEVPEEASPYYKAHQKSYALRFQKIKLGLQPFQTSPI